MNEKLNYGHVNKEVIHILVVGASDNSLGTFESLSSPSNLPLFLLRSSRQKDETSLAKAKMWCMVHMRGSRSSPDYPRARHQPKLGMLALVINTDQFMFQLTSCLSEHPMCSLDTSYGRDLVEVEDVLHKDYKALAWLAGSLPTTSSIPSGELFSALPMMERSSQPWISTCVLYSCKELKFTTRTRKKTPQTY
ncbi:hypothetical protein SELMODRAFT_426743 [Selaginella moellendorffii]|uniref:Uncharacterized protein n=1 Tax=Selaginella moellendorffii TaxID=88036 RepID=D8SXC2_SELML|nr:hypothetical protein SELMODRAFT_426743 [Selaginella moellendorffii]